MRQYAHGRRAAGSGVDARGLRPVGYGLRKQAPQRRGGSARRRRSGQFVWAWAMLDRRLLGLPFGLGHHWASDVSAPLKKED
jgi:hypothetical protein